MRGQQVAHVRELVGDADAAGEEEDRAVGGEGFEAAVGAFEEAGERDDSGGGGGGAGVQARGHAGAFADDEGHGGDGAVGERGAEVGGGGGEFVGLEGAVGGRALLAPGHGEGVRHPEGEGGDVYVGVAARAEGPGPRHGEGEAAGVAGEGLDGEGGEAVAGGVTVDKAEAADGAVEEPEEDDSFDEVELGEGATDGVDVDAEEGEEGEELMQVDEGFVEGVADGRGGLDENKAQGAGADEAILEEGVVVEGGGQAVEAFGGVHVDGPCDGVGDGFQDYDSTYPSVEKIVCIEADPQQ